MIIISSEFLDLIGMEKGVVDLCLKARIQENDRVAVVASSKHAVPVGLDLRAAIIDEIDNHAKHATQGIGSRVVILWVGVERPSGAEMFLARAAAATWSSARAGLPEAGLPGLPTSGRMRQAAEWWSHVEPELISMQIVKDLETGVVKAMVVPPEAHELSLLIEMIEGAGYRGAGPVGAAVLRAVRNYALVRSTSESSSSVEPPNMGYCGLANRASALVASWEHGPLRATGAGASAATTETSRRGWYTGKAGHNGVTVQSPSLGGAAHLAAAVCGASPDIAVAVLIRKGLWAVWRSKADLDGVSVLPGLDEALLAILVEE